MVLTSVTAVLAAYIGIVVYCEEAVMNNFWSIVPAALLVSFLIPTVIELRRRKDKGPRKMPKKTLYRERAQVDSCQQLLRFDEISIDKIGKSVEIPDGAEIKENLVVNGDLRIGKNCHILGTLKANGCTEIDESSIIDGSILSRGQVTVKNRCIVGGVIVSAQDITLHDGVSVEAVTTDKSIRLGRCVRISKRIYGTTISDVE